MFVNSLFNDFLLENGLETWNDESTRDIICLEFDYGTRSYDKEIKHLFDLSRNSKNNLRKAQIKNDKILIEKAKNTLKKSDELLKFARDNRDEYTQMSVAELRTKLYNEGVDVEYISYKKNGDIKKKDIIHYVMLFRSTGKAKKGSCMFIREELYDKAIDFLRMGIKLPDYNAQIVEISAYAPLVASGIVGRIKINPKNILILEDVDKFFTTNVISVETDEEKHCIAKHIDNYKLKNTLFDGQALIDSSIFPSWANGYILLRQHFCKMAAFNTNIQQFFRDYFGDRYETATVKDMFGNDHFVKDIELITTDNAMKWLKFDISYDYWCEKVEENGSLFGIVKTSHPSKLGTYQKMSYQMVNSLDINTMEETVRDTVEYINKLKTDDKFFLEYLDKNKNFSNDYEVLIALCNHNCDFVYSSYFRERKKAIIMAYTMSLKSGEILQNADNLTVVGSPYAMLLYSTCWDKNIVDLDNTFSTEPDSIQCYSERFGNGEYLAGFRSPFNGRYNMSYLHNILDDRIKKYFNFGKNVIAVNMIGTDFQDRNNGSDQDSDFLYVTNHETIVSHAKWCYKNCNTIVNNIQKEKNCYNNTLDDYAYLDNKLSESQTDIGESSNLAQIAQSYSYNFNDQKYNDYVCILSVLAQVAIDNSKRRFDVDLGAEIKRIKKDMNIDTNLYPKFWSTIKRNFDKNNINEDLVCPMNYLSDMKLNKFRSKEKTIPMSEFFIKHELEKDKKQCKKVEQLIQTYSLNYSENRHNILANRNDWVLLRSDFDKLIVDINKTYISSNYQGLISFLIDRAFLITPYTLSKSSNIKATLGKNKPILLKTLYTVNPESFLKCFKEK